MRIHIFSPEIKNFFVNLVADTMSVRQRQNIIRPDMINLLMEAKKGKIPTYQELKDDLNDGSSFSEKTLNYIRKPELDDLDMTAQALIFHFGGFDTISGLLSIAAYELTVNEDVQRKLQDEIDETFKKCEGKLTYDALMKMKYLDMVINGKLIFFYAF